jgi:hypothetical protein
MSVLIEYRTILAGPERTIIAGLEWTFLSGQFASA